MKLTINLRLYDDEWNTIKFDHRCVDFGMKEKVVPVFQSMLKNIRKAARNWGRKGEEPNEDKAKSKD